jgi:hypothetical protein
MARQNNKPSPALLDRMLGEASWLLSHAEALTDYGRPAEAAVELGRAALCEEQVACLLEAAEQPHEAAIHRVSAASCHEQREQYIQAVTLLRAALSAELSDDYRAGVEEQLARCLKGALKVLRRAPGGGK